MSGLPKREDLRGIVQNPKQPLTARQIQLIRYAICEVAQTHELSEDETKELHGINDALRDIQRTDRERVDKARGEYEKAMEAR